MGSEFELTSEIEKVWKEEFARLREEIGYQPDDEDIEDITYVIMYKMHQYALVFLDRLLGYDIKVDIPCEDPDYEGGIEHCTIWYDYDSTWYMMSMEQWDKYLAIQKENQLDLTGVTKDEAKIEFFKLLAELLLRVYNGAIERGLLYPLIPPESDDPEDGEGIVLNIK